QSPSAIRSPISDVQPSTTPSLHHSIPPNSTAWPGPCSFLAVAGAHSHLEPAVLAAESWEFLLPRAHLYPAGHISRWHHRGSLGCVLPDGFDPNSLASEAIAEFLHKSARQSELLDWTITEIQRDLERRVRRHINRLHHRSENRLVRNEPDLVPFTLDDG